MTRAAAAMFPIFQGQTLILRSDLKVVLSRLLPRSPIARSRLWARLNVCCGSVSWPFLGVLNATAMVSASPS
jgi:hypothetical protein